MCVAATYAALLASSARASCIVTVGNGDSLYSLARHYRVTIHAICVANHITRDTLLENGRKLTIPSPQKGVHAPVVYHRWAKVCADRVGIRIGPSMKYNRVDLVDVGTPVTVTAKVPGWFQVTLSDGKSGWVDGRFLRFSEVAFIRTISARPNHPTMADNQRIAVVHPHPLEHHAVVSHRVAAYHRKQADHHPYRKIAQAHEANRHGYSGREIVRTALAYRGVPYRWAGESPRGFDCSGFTSYIFRRDKGVDLPHSASEQAEYGKPVKHLKPGDLVFFHTYAPGISHVGIYIGHGKFVHASSPGHHVRVDSLSESYYREHYRGARRIIR